MATLGIKVGDRVVIDASASKPKVSRCNTISIKTFTHSFLGCVKSVSCCYVYCNHVYNCVSESVCVCVCVCVRACVCVCYSHGVVMYI